jgi:DNA repair protein RecO (recombination protein O)
MLQSTKGIVLHTVKYSETSLIAKIYTETFGLQSYIIKGIRKQKSKTRPAILQHLSLVNMVVYHRERATLHTLKEIQIAYPYSGIPFDIRKSSLALFINELLYKSIREEEPNPGLFGFIWESCLRLDASGGPFIHYPHWYAIHLTAWLGFMPRNNYSVRNRFFDLQEGLFVASVPAHQQFLDAELSGYLHKLIGLPFDELPALKIPAELRGLFLEKIILYYQVHLSGFTGLRSHQILHTVLG